MGFFKSLFNAGEAPVQKPSFRNECEASVAILFAAANADGDMDDLEIDNMIKAVTLKASFRQYDQAGYFTKAKDLCMKLGAGEVVSAAASTLSESTKKAVFVMCVDLLLSNGTVDASENKFINELHEALGLDPVWSEVASEIILLKYS